MAWSPGHTYSKKTFLWKLPGLGVYDVLMDVNPQKW